MHAFLTTIPFTTDTGEREQLIADYNRTLDGVDGLMMKIWFRDDISVGVAHFFHDADELVAYLNSGLLATLSNHNGCNGSVTSRVYEVPYADMLMPDPGAREMTSHLEVQPEAGESRTK